MMEIWQLNFATILLCQIVGNSATVQLHSKLSKKVKTEGTRIINGDAAIPGEFPYMISVQDAPNFKSICGGSLMTTTHVLTACHCVAYVHNYFGTVIGTKFPQNVSLLAGTVDLEKWSEKGTRRETSNIRPHPNCGKEGIDWVYDLAMITALSPFPLKTGEIQLLELPHYTKHTISEMTSVHVNCDVMGWGNTSSDGEKTTTLMKAKLNLQSSSRCRLYFHQQAIAKKDYEKVTYSVYNEEFHVCTLSEDRKDNICQGDTGGPLLCNTGQGEVIFVGVAAWGVGCGLEEIPRLWTRADCVESWIRKVMNGTIITTETEITETNTSSLLLTTWINCIVPAFAIIKTISAAF